MIIEYRSLNAIDGPRCVRLIERLWGKDAALRALRQIGAMWDHDLPTAERPFFYVAIGKQNDGSETLLGFAGFRRSWIMDGAYELIWIAIEPAFQYNGIGAALTQLRIDAIRARGGTVITLITSQPGFFTRLGFEPTANIYGQTLMVMALDKPFETRLLDHVGEADRERGAGAPA